jgi:hypothetical protein
MSGNNLTKQTALTEKGDVVKRPRRRPVLLFRRQLGSSGR